MRCGCFGGLAVFGLQSLVFSLQAFVVMLQGGVGSVELIELAFQLRVFLL